MHCAHEAHPLRASAASSIVSVLIILFLEIGGQSRVPEATSKVEDRLLVMQVDQRHRD